MGDHRLPKRVMSGELKNAGKRGPGGKEKEWTDCVADDLRLFGVKGDWRTAALDPNPPLCQTPGCRSVHSRSILSPSQPVLYALRPQVFRT